jgi:hypothetical protein
MLERLCALLVMASVLTGLGRAEEGSATALEGPNLEALIAKLADEDFALRQKAEDELHRLLHLTPGGKPNPVERACLAAYIATDDPEIRARVRSVLTDFAENLWNPVGVSGLTTTPDPLYDKQGKMTSRLRITKIQENSAAAAAGCRPGSHILGVDEIVFGTGNAKTIFAERLAARACGETLVLHILNEGRELKVPLVLGFQARPAPRGPEFGRQGRPQPEQCLREYLRVMRKSFPELAPAPAIRIRTPVR